ncbi:hypothetical protein [Paenibacillus agilis]|uniref:Uncharacterized protein n=1 Tax=Paenibacillus agilis TaxID=3020863 RepID=A0A559IDA0_9BACL|nr:hypothetical protein [Paenibacillus agilis]TVX85628.1 hypothetical protein FPZ44_25080 [Paenibacillus agilis]
MKDMISKLVRSKKMKALYVVSMMSLLFATAAMAAGKPADPKIIKGTQDVIKWFFTILNGIIPATTGLKFAWHAWQKSLSDADAGEVQQHNSAMKRTLIWGGIALGANAIVTVILWYLAPSK